LGRFSSIVSEKNCVVFLPMVIEELTGHIDELAIGGGFWRAGSR